jgi:hypothetical protein
LLQIDVKCCVKYGISERIVAVGEQFRVGGDHRSAKLNHEPPVEIKPEKLATRFTRRVRHGRLNQQHAIC